MNKPLVAGDIRDISEKMKEEILEGQRDTAIFIAEEMHRIKSDIITVIFSQSRKTREKIGYLTMVAKTLENNLDKVQFDQDTGISSKIELSVGAEIFGTGVKWVLDVDTGKASYGQILEAARLAPGLSTKARHKVESKLKKFATRFNK